MSLSLSFLQEDRMIDLKRSPEESAMHDSALGSTRPGEFYPLCLYACSPEVKKLGLDKIAVGEEFEVKVRFKLASMTIDEHHGSSASLVIEAMDAPKGSSDAKALYPTLKSSGEEDE